MKPFTDRIEEYAALHRRLEAGLHTGPSADPAVFLRSRADVAARIKSARPNARQGDIFSPGVDALFREIVAKTLEGTDTEALLRDLYAEHRAVRGFHPRVYEHYPHWGTHEMPCVLLSALPKLPEDIEYRLIDHDLLLLDIHADLIVDVLPDAISRPRSSTATAMRNGIGTRVPLCGALAPHSGD
jgi:hypothetical protein